MTAVYIYIYTCGQRQAPGSVQTETAATGAKLSAGERGVRDQCGTRDKQ